jgi:hypothetical protein
MHRPLPAVIQRLLGAVTLAPDVDRDSVFDTLWWAAATRSLATVRIGQEWQIRVSNRPIGTFPVGGDVEEAVLADLSALSVGIQTPATWRLT